ncbi:MAG: nucleotidyltransferase family protein [Desulfobacterales bacterium]|nr:MAG: nucleotidyltransferase family protein [Desulfobacterales bacterium]
MNPTTTAFTALVLAADRGSGNPVAEAAGVPVKSLTPVGGTPMVLRVLDALEAAQEVDTCILCGPPPTIVNQVAELRARIASGAVRWTGHQATPSSSTSHVLQSLPENTPVLVTTADHALLSARIVDYFCSEARTTGCDIAAGLAAYDSVLAAYPTTRRTAMRFRDGAYCGCNLFAFLTPRARAAADWWRRVEHQRKKPLRMMGALGGRNVLLYLLRRLTLTEGLEQISRRMGLRAGAVILPFPEAAVDVDKVSDWELVEAILARQSP